MFEGKVMCGSVEGDIDYWTRQPATSKVPNITVLEDCRMLCFNEPHCMIWSLDSKLSMCFLLELEQDESPVRKQTPGFVSGSLPCNQPALRGPGSLFCFALMQPNSYEQELLHMQHQRGTSLFACDAFEIYSNVKYELVPGVVTRVVDSSLKCDVGGEFGTALNLNIFLKVWEKVVNDGVFLQHDWTVKVDPDCVFFPNMLKGVLPHHPEVPQGTYLNNCKYGLHGPIEVFSRNAVKAWFAGTTQCQNHFNELCSGFCGWGEDMFIDQCLMKVLNSRRDHEWSLLTEDHCPKNPQEPMVWSSRLCASGDIAFHPFKTVDSYLECMAIAQTSVVSI